MLALNSLRGMRYECARHVTAKLLEESRGILNLELPMSGLVEHAAIIGSLASTSPAVDTGLATKSRTWAPSQELLASEMVQ